MASGPPNLGDNRFALLAPAPQTKRKKPSYSPLNFPALPVQKKDNPKFITISAIDTNKPLSKYSCFAVHKALESISKEIISITELRTGNLLLLVKNPQIAQKFISAKQLNGVCEIEAKFNDNLNSVKGTIYAPYLIDVDEKEIIENMSKQGVVAVYKFSRTVDSVSHHTGVILLTFDVYELPEKVEVSWRSAKVKPYYPNPMRCKTCQKLGHTTKRCNGTPACVTCSLPPHTSSCTRTFCTNCSGNHASSANTCPKYLQSKELLKIKCKNKCSMREAIKLYQAQTIPTLDTSFATKVRETQIQKNNNKEKPTSSTIISPLSILQNKSKNDSPSNIPLNNSSNIDQQNIPQTNISNNNNTQQIINTHESQSTNTLANELTISQPLHSFLQSSFNLESTLASIIGQTNKDQNQPITQLLTTTSTDSHAINDGLTHNLTQYNTEDQYMTVDDCNISPLITFCDNSIQIKCLR